MDTGVKMAYNINFHQTFKPEIKLIRKFLESPIKDLTKEDISEFLSIPTGDSSGKVIPMIKYCAAAKLINYNINRKLISIQLTKLGNNILSLDESFLESYEVQTFIHYQFCTINSDLELWEVLFRKFSSLNRSFSREMFINYANNLLGTKITKKTIQPVINTYIDDNCLQNIDLISLNDKLFKFNRIRILDFNYKWYAYFLYDFLTRLDNSKLDFHFSKLKIEGFATIFGWSDEDLYHVLNILDKNGYICFEKQYNDPYISLKKIDIDDLII